MLSVPTLWTVFVVNFMALGLVWAYVMRSYPAFAPARYWTGSAFTAAAGASLAMVRVVMTDAMLPLLLAGTVLILALCLAAMGVRQFFQKSLSWRFTLLVTGLGFAGLSFFTFFYDSVPGRLTVFTIAEAIPLALNLKLLLTPQQGRLNPGARLAGIVTVFVIAIFSVRLLSGVTGLAGGFAYAQFTPVQSVLVLVLVFLSMALNFGFLLDGHRTSAQRSRGSGAARRPHRRRQSPPFGAAPDRRNARDRSAAASRSRCW